jgi:hypothetical protein
MVNSLAATSVIAAVIRLHERSSNPMAYRLSVLLFPVMLLPLCIGCDNAVSPTSKTNNQTISGGQITIENGQLTEGRIVVTEDVEKEVYKSLNHRRKMMAAIKEKSGSSQGLQQMQDELNLLSKMFMSKYGLSEAEIGQILKKGDSAKW